MNKRLFSSIVVLLCSLILVSHAWAITKSTIEDQENVEVTVYNNNLALIKDARKIKLPKGEVELRFMDVALHSAGNGSGEKLEPWQSVYGS